ATTRCSPPTRPTTARSTPAGSRCSSDAHLDRHPARGHVDGARRLRPLRRPPRRKRVSRRPHHAARLRRHRERARSARAVEPRRLRGRKRRVGRRLRLQLIRLLAAALAAAVLTALFCGAAFAEDRVDASLSYFVEPAPRETLHVFHPQVNANVDLHRAISVQVSYDADVVSGATPRTYGTPMDAISSATKFSDVRHAFHGGVEGRIGPTTLSAGYTYAFENDYRSHAIDASARVDLWGKNTTFRLDYSHNFDSVCNADNRGVQPLERQALTTSTGCFNSGTKGILTEPLAIDGYAASWTQVLTPIVLTELSVGFQVLDGFQSNPYRRVRLFSGTVEAQESEPLLRQRFSVQARVRVAIRKLRAAVGASGRAYWDSWGVKSGTAEVSWEQYMAPQWLLRVRGRFYQQGRALFYR